MTDTQVHIWFRSVEIPCGTVRVFKKIKLFLLAVEEVWPWYLGESCRLEFASGGLRPSALMKRRAVLRKSFTLSDSTKRSQQSTVF